MAKKFEVEIYFCCISSSIVVLVALKCCKSNLGEEGLLYSTESL